MISDKEFEQAEQRGREMQENVPHAVEAMYVPSIQRVLIQLSNGLEISILQDRYATLRNANTTDLSSIELNAGGFEIYFPKLDEGFWVPDLLGDLLGVRSFLKANAQRETTELAGKTVAA